MADTESIRVAFCNDVTISNIEPAYAQINDAFQQAGPIVLDIADVAEADLTFIQLIESARLTAAKTGRSLALGAPADGAVLEILQRGGFLEDHPADRTGFWLQETAPQ
ncbi:MAG: hypothetical protein JWR59_397 [Brevundimonas sp.]|nr:hypothetical protein [Brevundimonas sp.]